MAIVAPHGDLDPTVRALSRTGYDVLAITLPRHTLPLAATDLPSQGTYAEVVSHDSPRRTLAHLRRYRVSAVVAGSAPGIAVADELAARLKVSGAGTQRRRPCEATAANRPPLSRPLAWPPPAACGPRVCAPPCAGPAFAACRPTYSPRPIPRWPARHACAARRPTSASPGQRYAGPPADKASTTTWSSKKLSPAATTWCTP
ncbi:hypothetical protein [Streptomyces lydicus]|uniref:hypothetical protein n=1 Tax=Streptomyces lydicus TaxID=47763 RepID=UPI0036E7D24D